MKNSGKKKQSVGHVSAAAIEKSGKRRSYLIAVCFIALTAVLVSRLYSLQIVNGERYQEAFQSRIRRTVVTRAARGAIRDRNGHVLAETRSSYNITMNDLTDDSAEDDKILNDRIRQVMEIVHDHDDDMRIDFSVELTGGSFFFKEMGQTARSRFLADVYGYADTETLTDQERDADAEDVFADIIEFRIREKRRERAKQNLEKGTVNIYNGCEVREHYDYASRLCG